VKRAHPEATAVASGAILSNYQRVRIEHVATRLKLTSLAYLWQMNQGEMLDSMEKVGQEAVLAKIAGVGFKISHVGKTIREMRPFLNRMVWWYG
jgi:diphthine-ammonia ligase